MERMASVGWMDGWRWLGANSRVICCLLCLFDDTVAFLCQNLFYAPCTLQKLDLDLAVCAGARSLLDLSHIIHKDLAFQISIVSCSLVRGSEPTLQGGLENRCKLG